MLWGDCPHMKCELPTTIVCTFVGDILAMILCEQLFFASVSLKKPREGKQDPERWGRKGRIGKDKD